MRAWRRGRSPRRSTLPPELEKDWSVRAITARFHQGAMAVYQRYVGWYDGNPANLNRLPPVEEAKKAGRVYGRGRCGHRPGARGFQGGQLSLGGGGDGPGGVRRSVQQDRRANWRRMPSNRWAMAPKTARRAVPTFWRRRNCGATLARAGRSTPAISPEILHVMSAAQHVRLSRHTDRRAARRRGEDRDQLALHRYQRDADVHLGAWRADLHRREGRSPMPTPA